MVQRTRAGWAVTNVGAWCVAVLLALAAPAWAGATLRDENRKAEARKDYEEALAIYRELAARVSAIYESTVEAVEQKLRSLSP